MMLQSRSPAVGELRPTGIVLASGSPRRRELMGRLLGGLPGHSPAQLVVEPADVDETPLPGESPTDLVERLAASKARAVSGDHPNALVVGADTVVDIDGTILGKPVDRQDAVEMLQRLSGRPHAVHTGIALVGPGDATVQSWVETTLVAFRDLTDGEIEVYVDTGEPMDKAGAYGIQGEGGRLVESIDGSFDNVVGLPLDRLRDLLSCGF